MILYDYSQLNLYSVLLISVKCSLIIDYVKSKAGAEKKGATASPLDNRSNKWQAFVG